jgi:uncharacterized RDD family membrane protein YckC
MNWYYADSGRQVGPITETDLEALVRTGTITPDTLVWHDGMVDWQPYGRVNSNPLEKTTPAGVAVIADVATCAQCGMTYAQEEMVHYGNLWICATCKPTFVQKLKEGGRLPGAMTYAGFWIRFGARVIDVVILWVVNTLLSFVPGLMIAKGNSRVGVLALQAALYLIQFLIGLCYTTWFLGRYGATPGKMACGLRVVTASGGKVSYARACARHFADVLNWFTFLIGYLMAAFDDEKRALHDHICNTRVVKR